LSSGRQGPEVVVRTAVILAICRRVQADQRWARPHPGRRAGRLGESDGHIAIQPGAARAGDTGAQAGDHPWAVSTASFAELYYRLAGKIIFGGTVPFDSLSAGFFTQVGIDASTTPGAAAALQAAGDQMLQASSSTATTSSSARSSTPPPGTRRASATCPGATPHSCPRSAPGTPPENPFRAQDRRRRSEPRH
jgi:hypothetical protein